MKKKTKYRPAGRMEATKKLLKIPWEQIFEVKNILPTSRLFRILRNQYHVEDTYLGLLVTNAVKFNLIRPLKKSMYFEYTGPKKIRK